MLICLKFFQVFAISEFYQFVHEILRVQQTTLTFEGMRLVYLLMDADYQQYGAKIASLDRDKPMDQHVAKMLLNKIMALYKPLLNLPKLGTLSFLFYVINAFQNHPRSRFPQKKKWKQTKIRQRERYALTPNCCVNNNSRVSQNCCEDQSTMLVMFPWKM